MIRPEPGVVPTAQFIPLAGEAGLIVPIGLRLVTMAVNLGLRQLADASLLHDLNEALPVLKWLPHLRS